MEACGTIGILGRGASFSGRLEHARRPKLDDGSSCGMEQSERPSNCRSMSKETPKDDPRQQTDWKNTKQTDEPWKGATEKEQFDPNRPKPDLEKWKDANTS